MVFPVVYLLIPRRLSGRHPLTPPALPGRRSCRGRCNVENRLLSDRRADVVEVGTEHDQYGEEGEAEAEAPDAAAAQREAEPVDEPAPQKTTQTISYRGR